VEKTRYISPFFAQPLLSSPHFLLGYVGPFLCPIVLSPNLENGKKMSATRRTFSQMDGVLWMATSFLNVAL